MSNMRANAATMVKSEKDVDDVADRLTATLTGLMNELTPLQTAWLGPTSSSDIVSSTKSCPRTT